jgi:hypothetical protein
MKAEFNANYSYGATMTSGSLAWIMEMAAQRRAPVLKCLPKKYREK